MSDFGFDAYALDDLDPSEQLDPLEIAHDLIAEGKPRAALELLGDHHAQLADDPEYLLLCSAAWWAAGDSLRAQQALQGAARLAPDDPRPLQGLGEILAERGERDKAELLFAKARTLEDRVSVYDEADDDESAESEDDLIAFAERRERTTQAALTPRQIVFGLLGLILLGLLIAGIAALTSSSEEPESRPATAREETAIPDEPVSPTTLSDLDVDTPVEAEAEAEVEAVPAPAPASAPVPVPASASASAQASGSASPSATASAPKPASKPAPRSHRASTQRARPVAKVAAPTPKSTSKEPDNPPSEAVVQSELASMSPNELTARADELYARGHTSVAASYYRRALEIDPDYAPALVGIGRSILRAKKYSDAMKNATRALQLARGVDARPGLEAAAIYQMGRVHYERGERDAARRLFRQSISLPNTPPEAWFYLGEALSSDNSPAARQAYEQYLDRVPTGHLSDRARRAIQ